MTETAPPRTIHDFCLLAKGISFSERHDPDQEDNTNKYDTDESVKQVKDFDLVFERTCAETKTQ